MKLRNRLLYWRSQYQVKIGKHVSQAEFGRLLGKTRSQINLWEHHKSEPDRDTSWEIWKILKSEFVNLHYEDLWEEENNPE